MSKEVVYEDDDFALEEQIEQGVVFIHLLVYRFNKTVLKKMQGMFQVLKGTYKEDGYGEIFAFTPDPKFCRLIDPSAKTIESGVVRGKKMEVLVWDLTP